jgi:DNA-binding NtrC family response regulator
MIDVTGVSILFVDDEADILSLLSRMMKGEVDRIFTSVDPNEAIEIVRKNDVSIAVLDLKMPKMNGIELMQELLKVKPGLPCIFLSGYGDKESIRDALRLGAENFIDKPFDERYLKLAVRRAIEKVRYEELMRDILELFIQDYTKLDFENFGKLSPEEKDKTLRAALGVAKLQIEKKKGK